MACILQHLGNTARSHASGLGSELLQHSQFLTPVLYYYFVQFQKTTGSYTGSTQLFQFHCVDMMAPICTATVSKFLYSGTNWPKELHSILQLFHTLPYSLCFLLHTWYQKAQSYSMALLSMTLSGTKYFAQGTQHASRWKASFLQFCPAERFFQRTSEDIFIG